LPHAATRPGGPATNIDRFIAEHEPGWRRLGELVRRVGRDPRGVPADELAELVRLHLRTSSHLSTVRTLHADPELAAYLSQLVARSGAIVHGSRPRTWRTLLVGVRDTFPAALWHARRPILLSAGLFCATFLVVAVWLVNSPAALDAFFPDPGERQQLLEEDFEAYYSAEPGTTFAARVFTNNAGVGILAFGAGILAGVPTLLVLVLNGANVGLAGGLFHASGEAAHFWGLILPHGLLELTGVFIAGGAGLRLGWAVLAPGDRTRRRAVAEEGRRAVVIVIGLVGVFAVAGLLEGYVTPADVPTSARVATGAAVWAAFLAYAVLLGRAAAARGLTGALGEASHQVARSSREPAPSPGTDGPVVTGSRVP
jgi:uncharacterized membrane protein SpoIIM required for sporulation